MATFGTDISCVESDWSMLSMVSFATCNVSGSDQTIGSTDLRSS
jgi:hypothetical protein